MKMNLKTRLIISYTALSMFLIFSLLFVSNFLLEKQFNSYIKEKQEKINLNIVASVSTELETGKPPNLDNLLDIGEKALDEGVILMVNDKFGNEIFCMSCIDNMGCEHMLTSMESSMKKRYPHFDGKYMETTYPVTKDGVNLGTVKLGYYGPFYYNEADMKFIEVLNSLFIKASLLFLGIAFIVGYYMANRFSEPIKAVIAKTREIERGDYINRIEFSSTITEINSLINSVNSLASTLQTQQMVKKRMAIDYAHEFRTPLTIIQSNLEGIIDGVFEPTNERIESMRQEILRLSRMVSEIDNIVEIEKIENELEKEEFDLSQLLQQTVLSFENEANAKNITLKLKTEPCIIFADMDKIRQVSINLLSNALKYTDAGEIVVTVKSYNDVACFSVLDTGIGISDNEVKNIFEHLYRVDQSRTRETGGTGIGLSVVKVIVEAHNGKIEVKSELGHGSEFIVTVNKK